MPVDLQKINEQRITKAALSVYLAAFSVQGRLCDTMAQSGNLL